MLTSHESVCCTEIGKCGKKWRNKGLKPSWVASQSIQVFSQPASISGCWRPPITRTDASRHTTARHATARHATARHATARHATAQLITLKTSKLCCFLSDLLHFEIDFLEFFLCYRFNNTEVQLIVSSSLQEISLHCLQTTCSLVLGLSWQTCEGRSAILCGKQNPKHFSSGVWNILHWIKTASPLRETKVHVNADHNYSCLTALAVEPVRQETFMYCFPSPPKHYYW